MLPQAVQTARCLNHNWQKAPAREKIPPLKKMSKRWLWPSRLFSEGLTLMADVNVVKQSSNQSAKENTLTAGLERQQGGGPLSRRWTDPFGSWLSPAEFFNTNPFTLMRRMSEEMDRQFSQFFGHTSGGTGSWYPAVEVTESNGQLQVHAELPGIKPEDVKVEITNDALVISGERKSEHEHRIGRAYRSERQYGQFYREIPLPEGVRADEAKAQFREGVLQITVPVPEQASNRREIPIQTGETGRTAGKGPASAESARQTAASKAAG
jgi:HSP20 family protein